VCDVEEGIDDECGHHGGAAFDLLAVELLVASHKVVCFCVKYHITPHHISNVHGTRAEQERGEREIDREPRNAAVRIFLMSSVLLAGSALSAILF
jgi:hypothetical protein